MSGIARPHLRWPGFIHFADIALFIYCHGTIFFHLSIKLSFRND